MKTLTLRNIPDDVKSIIESELPPHGTASKTIFRIIRKYKRIITLYETLKESNNDSKRSQDPFPESW